VTDARTTPCEPCAERAAAAELRHEVTAASLPADAVPWHPPGLAWWRREGEVVIDRGEHGSHVLNESAALIWLNLDGEMSVGALVDALHDETQVPRDVLEQDVRSAVIRMAGIGLLVLDPTHRSEAQA
jgi:hypothetical protein